jgi:hypothetical protein
MPIIVNELVFRGTIAGPKRDESSSSSDDRQAPVDTRALIEACVEEILKIVEREKER